MRITSLTLIAALAAGLAGPGGAQTQTMVGKAVVDGKTVTLYSDKSWSFDEASDAAPGCLSITPKLSFCGDPKVWVRIPPQSPVINAAFRLNASTYAQQIVENIGTSAGLSPDFLKDAVLQFAKTVSGSPPVVLGVEPAEFQGKTLETLIYQFTMNGVPVVFANTIYMSEQTAAQIITYEVSSTYTDAHKQAHAEFLADTRIVEQP